MDITRNQSWFLNGYQNCSLRDQQEKYLKSATFIMLSIAGIIVLVINCGVFIIFMKEKKIRSNPYYFLVLMLSVSDFTVGLGIMCICAKQIIPHLSDNKILTVLQIFLMTTGLYLSLLQTFLISFQRYLIICKESVHSSFFNQKRKYFVCFGGWFAVVITNCVLVSPPPRKFNPCNDQLLPFVYSGFYLAHTVYSRFLSVTLLSLTLILYFKTIKHIKMESLKVQTIWRSNIIHVKAVKAQKDQQSSSSATSDPKEKNTTSSSANKINAKPAASEVRCQLAQIRHKKVMSTVYLVGLLISALLIFTGPLIIALWVEKCSSEVMGVLFCLSIANAVANPFIYLWKLVDVRKYTKSAICCYATDS